MPARRLGELIKPAAVERAGRTSLPILSMTMRDGLVDQSSKFKKRVASADTSQYRVVSRGQLVVGFPIDEGVLAIQDVYDKAIVSPAYAIWDVSPLISGAYLQRFLRSPRAISYYVSKLRGTTARRRSLPPELFLHLSVALPKLEQQLRIADLLDRADGLRAKRIATLRLIKEAAAAVFENFMRRSDATESSIGQLLDTGALALHKDGNHGSLYPRGSEFGSTGVPFLTAKSISEDGALDQKSVEFLAESAASRLRHGWLAPGDVLLSHNASVGKVAMYDGEFEQALIGTSLTAFRPDPAAIDARFLTAALRAPHFQRQLAKDMAQTTRNQVPITAQRKLSLRLPSLSEQVAYATHATRLDHLVQANLASLGRLEELFASLQRRAFAGQL
jgi:type I restriction enzyme, S subunit